MDYAQVLLKMPANTRISRPLGGPEDDPIKHPCLWKGPEGELAPLGGAELQPVVVIDDSTLWTAIADYAMNNQQGLDAVITSALRKLVQGDVFQ